MFTPFYLNSVEKQKPVKENQKGKPKRKVIEI